MTTTTKSLITEIFQLLEKYGYETPAPIDEELIDKFKVDFLQTFQREVDDFYLEFLKMCNGLEFNGTRFYASINQLNEKSLYGIFETNEFWTYDDDTAFIYFGDSDLEKFVLKKDENQYLSISRYTEDILEIFETFEEMLHYALKLMRI